MPYGAPSSNPLHVILRAVYSAEPFRRRGANTGVDHPIVVFLDCFFTKVIERESEAAV
jgi:hypothetical protein